MAKIATCLVDHPGVANECAFFKCRIAVLAFTTPEYKAVDKCVLDTCKCKAEVEGGCDMDALIKADCDAELKAQLACNVALDTDCVADGVKAMALDLTKEAKCLTDNPGVAKECDYFNCVRAL